jgi:predicted transport protein
VEHREEFESLVMERLGEDAGRTVDWSNPRVVCVATDYTRYDVVAASMSHHRVDLLAYRQYARDLVTLELVATVAGGCGTRLRAGSPNRSEGTGRRGVRHLLDSASADLRNLFSDLEERLLDLGDGMCVELQHYWAFRRRRNFACVRVTRDFLVVVLNVDPSTVALKSGWTRDLRGVGHLGTGDLEVRIAGPGDLDRAAPLFEASWASAPGRVRRTARVRCKSAL